MKPKTKHQKHVFELNKKIKKFSKGQLSWADREGLDHEGVRLKSGKITCLDCGTDWQSDSKQEWHDVILDHECPGCKRKIKVKTTRQKNSNDWNILRFFQVSGDYQIIRFMKIQGTYKAGEPRDIWHQEIARFWISKEGKMEVFRKTLMGWNSHFSGDLSLKANREFERYDIEPYKTYPRKKFIPELYRNGFKGGFHDIKPVTFCMGILGNPIAETLLKANQISLLSLYLNYRTRVEQFWPSIKIVLKNQKIIYNASDYMDYLRMLEEFGRDLLNAKYVCPADIHKEHQRYLEKMRLIRRKQNIAELKAEIKNDNIRYKKEKAKFMKLKFVRDNMEIVPIKSVRQVYDESSELRHCAFEREYYKKRNYLLFSVRVNGEIVETAEINTDSLSIVQVRGRNNKQTSYYPLSVALLNDNLELIKKAMKPKRKNKTTKNNNNSAVAA